MPVPKVTLRSLFVGVAVAVAAFQLVAVTLAALPPNRYTDAAAPHTGYLAPYFTQNWRLFAPNPVSEDRSVLFQGSYVAADGSTRTTPWVDWTEVELDLVHHKFVGGRAGYITNKLFSPLGQRYGRLGAEQRKIVDATPEESPPDWPALRSAMVEGGVAPGAAAVFLRYERVTTQLATDVLESRWPDRTFTAVRYEMRRHDVVPYASRSGSDAERKAARPAATLRDSGWRVPSPGDADERKVIADFDRRHR